MQKIDILPAEYRKTLYIKRLQINTFYEIK